MGRDGGPKKEREEIIWYFYNYTPGEEGRVLGYRYLQLFWISTPALYFANLRRWIPFQEYSFL